MCLLFGLLLVLGSIASFIQIVIGIVFSSPDLVIKSLGWMLPAFVCCFVMEIYNNIVIVLEGMS